MQCFCSLCLNLNEMTDCDSSAIHFLHSFVSFPSILTWSLDGLSVGHGGRVSAECHTSYFHIKCKCEVKNCTLCECADVYFGICITFCYFPVFPLTLTLTATLSMYLLSSQIHTYIQLYVYNACSQFSSIFPVLFCVRILVHFVLLTQTQAL